MNQTGQNNSYSISGGHHLRQKSGERKKEGGFGQGPIDIFVDVDSPTDPNVLMKSPSNASIHNNNVSARIGQLGQHAAHEPTNIHASTSPIMNNLEARIKQR